MFGGDDNCVSIALVEDSIPVIGVIYNHISDEMFYAQKNYHLKYKTYQ